MASRSFDTLAPQFRDRFKAWHVAAQEAAGCDLLVTCTYRSPEEQDALYAIGRTKPGRKVTNAKAGQSAHNYGLALDFVPMENGKPVWDEGHNAWRKAGNLAPSFGLEWAGTWPTFREYPHVQVHNWKELAGERSSQD
jgi:peptidoglycan L-alanyl-D-glutamate endopeptidase CwlK